MKSTGSNATCVSHPGRASGGSEIDPYYADAARLTAITLTDPVIFASSASTPWSSACAAVVTAAINAGVVGGRVAGMCRQLKVSRPLRTCRFESCR